MDVGVPRCWNDSPELVSAALVGPHDRTDDIKRVAGSRWIQAAQNRGTWNSLQKTYVQQWMMMKFSPCARTPSQKTDTMK
ncbi:jg4947 [Pararge aegeria aegeria]|uniref:Jg4947 protein n=1 Tax=Pararge aegeria aegeria TaxID=348720 RepID=A0A8S4SCL2_9NEOP|nr:jg4947 [Pararge aegeria aegeria]